MHQMALLNYLLMNDTTALTMF